MEEQTTIVDRHPQAVVCEPVEEETALIRIRGVKHEVEFIWGWPGVVVIELLPVSRWELIYGGILSVFWAMIRIKEIGGRHVDRSHD